MAEILQNGTFTGLGYSWWGAAASQGYQLPPGTDRMVAAYFAASPGGVRTTWPAQGIKVNVAEVALTSSTTETDMVTATLPTGVLNVGTTFRIKMRGTIQSQATSGALTFKFYIAGVAHTATAVMSSVSTASPQSSFFLEAELTVRSTGASGTYVCASTGQILTGQATTINIYPTAANVAATATINTATATPIVKVTAQWATNSATNILKVETGSIELIYA